MKLWIPNRPAPRRRPVKEAPRPELRLPLQAPRRDERPVPEDEDDSASKSMARGVVDVDFYV